MKYFFPKKKSAGSMPAHCRQYCRQTFRKEFKMSAGSMPAYCRQYAGRLWKKIFGKNFQKIRKYFFICILLKENFFWQKVKIICYIWTTYLISKRHIATGIDGTIWRFDYFKRGCNLFPLKTHMSDMKYQMRLFWCK